MLEINCPFLYTEHLNICLDGIEQTLLLFDVSLKKRSFCVCVEYIIDIEEIPHNVPNIVSNTTEDIF